MASKQISIGVGIPMIVVGVILAFILAPMQADLKDTVEFIGSLIGILGILIFIAGFLSRKVAPIAS
ncbi:MAG: hypothetical protein KGH76_00710 [Thaumarchaeota archaeon]|nr:hypothetical protein [Nitrososphaerota archaeon]MDE1842484.1 hypothetical protein [Nitrososphaerota archaeon]